MSIIIAFICYGPGGSIQFIKTGRIDQSIGLERKKYKTLTFHGWCDYKWTEENLSGDTFL